LTAQKDLAKNICPVCPAQKQKDLSTDFDFHTFGATVCLQLDSLADRQNGLLHGLDSQGRYFWPDVFRQSIVLTDGSICA
jgi:hypothetical protein